MLRYSYIRQYNKMAQQLHLYFSPHTWQVQMQTDTGKLC